MNESLTFNETFADTKFHVYWCAGIEESLTHGSDQYVLML